MAYAACPNCDSTRLYQHKKPIPAGGGQAPDFLDGLGTFWSAAKFDIVVCSDCGLTRYFASRDVLEKLRTSDKWQPI